MITGDDMASFGELLSELRKDRGMTQRDLGQVLHVSVSTISNYEKDVHLPDVEKLVNIADFFHVTTDYLLGRTEYNVSLDELSKVVLRGKTVAEVVEMLQVLNEEQLNALGVALDDMYFKTSVIHKSQETKRNRDI